MVFVVHGDGRFVPIENQVVGGVKFQHVPHRNQIGFHVANHDFHPGSIAVVHFPDSPGTPVFHVIHRGEIVEPNVFGGLTAIGESHFFLDRNRGFG